jgi:hypothetical protein
MTENTTDRDNFVNGVMGMVGDKVKGEPLERVIGDFRVWIDFDAGYNITALGPNGAYDQVRDVTLSYLAQTLRIMYTSLERQSAKKAVDPLTMRTLAAEDFQPGLRYWDVRPGFESDWTVTSVAILTTEAEVFRDGKWVLRTTVTVTRRDGNVRVFDKGEKVAIQGPWRTED